MTSRNSRLVGWGKAGFATLPTCDTGDFLMMKLGRIAIVGVSLLVVCRGSNAAKNLENITLPSPEELFSDVECPLDCEDLFRKLEDGPQGKTKSVRLQVRGEPKSGTGVMERTLSHFFARLRPCDHLKPIKNSRRFIFG